MKCIVDGDTFIHKDIFPKRIVTFQGNIKNESELLLNKTLQITTNEKSVTTLRNSITGKNAYIVLDFGKELHGKLRLLTYTCSGTATPSVRITYGESVSEALSTIGKKGSTNDHSTRDFEFPFPQFSDISLNESGFRFAKIELLSKNASVSFKAVTAISIYRDIPYLGSFSCSDEILNKIYDVCAYTCHLNMQRYIWDGIKRDRLVWVGDMHPEMLTVRTVFGNHSIIEKSLRFMRETTPLPEWMNGMPTYSLWWLHILYDWYLYTENNDFLAENKEYTLELINIICNLVNDDGSDKLPSYFIDWPCNGKKAGISGSRALLAISLESASELAKIYNNEQLAALCRKKKEALISTTAETYGAKQVAAMCSLAGWLNKDAAATEILKDGAKGFSTFMSYYLLKAASQKDISATLSALKDYYGGMLKMGATTFWEDFDILWLDNAAPIDDIVPHGKNDIHADNGAFCYKGLRHSLCHGWSSAPAAFLAEEVLGIKILEPGCKKIKIEPSLGYLEYAEGTYPTPSGIIKVHCKKTADGVAVKYEAPDDIEIVTDNKGE